MCLYMETMSGSPSVQRQSTTAKMVMVYQGNYQGFIRERGGAQEILKARMVIIVVPQ